MLILVRNQVYLFLLFLREDLPP